MKRPSIKRQVRHDSGETIAEIAFPSGKTALLSLSETDETARVHLYRAEDGIAFTVGRPPRPHTTPDPIREHAAWIVKLFGTDDPRGLAQLAEHVAALRQLL